MYLAQFLPVRMKSLKQTNNKKEKFLHIRNVWFNAWCISLSFYHIYLTSHFCYKEDTTKSPWALNSWHKFSEWRKPTESRYSSPEATRKPLLFLIMMWLLQRYERTVGYTHSLLHASHSPCAWSAVTGICLVSQLMLCLQNMFSSCFYNCSKDTRIT